MYIKMRTIHNLVW